MPKTDTTSRFALREGTLIKERVKEDDINQPYRFRAQAEAVCAERLVKLLNLAFNIPLYDIGRLIDELSSSTQRLADEGYFDEDEQEDLNALTQSMYKWLRAAREALDLY